MRHILKDPSILLPSKEDMISIVSDVVDSPMTNSLVTTIKVSIFLFSVIFVSIMAFLLPYFILYG